jgi:hypothetical protein
VKQGQVDYVASARGIAGESNVIGRIENLAF